MEDKMIKYKTRASRRWGVDAEIEKVEIERETEHCIWINGRKNSKKSEWGIFHDSFDDAKNYLLSKQQSYVNSLHSQLESAKVILGTIKILKQQ